MLDPKILIRNAIEALIDDISKNPQLFEHTAKSMLNNLGIESSLDVVLGYMVGMCQGSVSSMVDYAVVEFDISNPDDLIIEIMEDVFRKIIELREIMISQRIHE